MVVNGTSGVLKGNNSNFSKVVSYRTVLFTHLNVFRCNCYEMSLLYLISFYLTEFEHLPQFCFSLHNFHSFLFFGSQKCFEICIRSPKNSIHAIVKFMSTNHTVHINLQLIFEVAYVF